VIDPTLLQQLRLLVGKHVEYSGHACRVIEILDSEKAIVLRCENKPPSRHSVYRPLAAGMLPSSVQGCIYRVSVNTMSAKQRTHYLRATVKLRLQQLPGDNKVLFGINARPRPLAGFCNMNTFAVP